MPRRSPGAFAAVVASLTVLLPVPAIAQPAPPVLVIEGKGFGHGVGMAQDGAYSMAAAGKSAAAILSHFYPGTAIARRTATVRVGIHESQGPVLVVLPSGGEVRDAASGAQSPGFPVTVSPGGSVSLAFLGGRYKATPVSGAAITRAPAPAPAPAPTAAAPPPAAPAAPGTTPTTGLLDPLLGALIPTTVPPTTAPGGAGAATAVPASQDDAFSGRGLWAVPKGNSTVSLPAVGRSYRGTVAAGAAGGGGLHLTNEVDVEQYLRGMGEMPASWPAAALQAQAIAARTYAIRAAAAGKTLCADQRCQVYIGAGNEHSSTSAATTATRGQVLTYQGALAEAVYSASGGGISATPKEGFGPGSPDIPYLRPVEYPVTDPQLWAMTLPVQQAGARFGYRGDVTDIRVSSTGPSGRPLEIVFEGGNGPMPVDAHRFWAELQLRSTLFTLRIESTPPEVQGEPLVENVAADSPPPAADDVPVAVALGPSRARASLGRAPWVGLAVLMLAGWGTGASRMTGRRPSTADVGSEGGGGGEGHSSMSDQDGKV